MDHKKTGEFICTLRKSKNLTQKELADLLGITDKAVSKWERGAGYPDISMLRPLADALGTTPNELLDSRSAEEASEPVTADIDNALDYAQKIINIREYRYGKLTAVILAVSLILAIITCMIVDLALNLHLSWSILVIDSCIFGGCITIPILLWQKRGAYLSLILLTLLILPFLGIIEAEVSALTGYNGWLRDLGVPVTLTWLIIIWLIVVFLRLKLSVLFKISFISFLCIPGSILTNHFVNQYIKVNSVDITNQLSNLITIFCLASASVICFAIGLYRKNK